MHAPRPLLILSAALALSCLSAVACGGGGQPPGAGEPNEPGLSRSAANPVSGRAGAGIAATGGRMPRGPGCSESGTDATTIAWVGPDIDELADIGLESLVLDEPSLVVDAYINEVNDRGGIGGDCFRLATFSWKILDQDSSFRKVCMDLPQEEPLVLFSLAPNNTTLRCATLGARIPTIGMLASVPEASLASAEGALLVDGSVEYLLAASLNIADIAGEVGADDRIGLLVTDRASAESEIETAATVSEQRGLPMVATAVVPAEFGTVGVSVAELQVRLMETGLSDSEIQRAVESFEALRPEQVAVLRSLEQFFLDTVSEMRNQGVTVVAASASSSDVRRLMLAAEQIDWTPKWLTSDAQAAELMLMESPARQARNLLQISARRAAGDWISELDTGCISMRNTSTAAPIFAHRTHTDAWNLTTLTCEFLDVVFGAMTRIDGPLNQESLLDALSMTDYETARGSHIRFGAGDHNGAERFRVLRADPDCVLNEWGCMRAASDWFAARSAP